MQSTPESIAVPVPAGVTARRERPVSDVVYQAVTIAAMLWLLISLWVF